MHNGSTHKFGEKLANKVHFNGATIMCLGFLKYKLINYFSIQ